MSMKNKLMAVLYRGGVLLGIGVWFIAASAGAEEWKKNVPYYDAEFPRTGNVECLNQRCSLDLRLPSGKKGFPTVIWLHGGGLSCGSKECPELFDPDKIAVAGINYRLSGANVSCPDYLYDAAAATAWVLKHIAEYGGDPKKVYLSGLSAGGYLSAMLALDKRYLEAFGASPLDLAGVFPISGQMTTHFQVLNERRAKDPRTPQIWLDEYAPIFVAGKETPPLVLIVGDSRIEWPARVEENQLLAARLQRVIGNDRVQLHCLSGFTHATVGKPGILLVNGMILKQCQGASR